MFQFVDLESNIKSALTNSIDDQIETIGQGTLEDHERTLEDNKAKTNHNGHELGHSLKQEMAPDEV